MTVGGRRIRRRSYETGAPSSAGRIRTQNFTAGGTGEIAEHGGADGEDRHVPLVVFGAGVTANELWSPVETTQIASTILHLLGLDPQLQAVQAEHTGLLPGT